MSEFRWGDGGGGETRRSRTRTVRHRRRRRSHPPSANQRVTFPVAGPDGLEYAGQSLVGKIEDEIGRHVVDDLRTFLVGLQHRGDRGRCFGLGSTAMVVAVTAA
ncbi:hypothetical protein ACFX1X_019958 [Malus domestica]